MSEFLHHPHSRRFVTVAMILLVALLVAVGCEDDSTTAPPPPPEGADLAVTKTADVMQADPGQEIEYTVTVTNNGTLATTGVTLSDPLPTGLDFVGSSATNGSYNDALGVWTVGDLDVGETATLRLVTEVQSQTVNAIITNTATITAQGKTDPDGSNNSASVDVLVGGADLALTKTVDNPTPDLDQQIVYTVTLTNNGAGDATNVEIEDVLPSGVPFVSANASAGSYDRLSGVWSLGGGAVCNGCSETLTITAVVSQNAPPTVITNTATIIGVDQPDPDPSNNSASAPILPGATGVDIAVTKTVDNANPAEGETIVFTVTATNNGPNDASQVQIQDVLPAGLTLDGAGASFGTYTQATGIWAMHSLDASQSETLVITATVDLGQAGNTITNTACLESVDEFDYNPDNDCGSADVTNLSIDLVVRKTVSNENPLPLDRIVYTISVENIGNGVATGVEVFDRLPIGIAFDWAQATVGDYDNTTGIWTIGVDGIDAGAKEVLLIVAGVSSGTEGQTISNTAEIASVDQTDPVPGNDIDDAVFTVQEIIFTALDKKVSDETRPVQGQPMVFTISVANLSSGDATGLILEDKLPAGLTYDSHSATSGTYDEATGEWVIGSLRAGVTAVLDITVILDAGTAGNQITNTVSVKAVDQEDDGGSPADITFTVQN